MTEEEILNILDHSNDGFYCSFVNLEHVYSYLIDTRLNVFRNNNDQWAIAVERLGYNPRENCIILDINYMGNCIFNLDYYNNRPVSYYSIYPVDQIDFRKTVDCERLKHDATYWIVRGQKVLLSHDKEEYLKAGIKLKEYEPDEIGAEEAGRLVVLKNRDLFRATDSELYKSIPLTLNKILVLDEWYHKDFQLQISSAMSEEQLRQTFELNKKLTGLGGMSFESFVKSVQHQDFLSEDWEKEMWEKNRPSSYETWQLISKVIVTNDPSLYKPTLKPNTHWTN